MSSIATALQGLRTHSDVVPAYYIRSKRQWIITNITPNNGGCVVVGEDGQIVRSCTSKRAALNEMSK